MGLFKNARQVMLNLERRNQPLGQQLKRIGSHNVRGSHGGRALFQQPGDIAALMPLDAFKLKHRGPGAGFLLGRAAQIIFEPGMAG